MYILFLGILAQRNENYCMYFRISLDTVQWAFDCTTARAYHEECMYQSDFKLYLTGRYERKRLL